MPEKESAQSVIEAYRRRQQMTQRAPIILVVAAVLLVLGAAVIIFWLLGSRTDGAGQFSLPFMSTDTPTPTATFTPTLTPTPTNTPTQTPTELPPTETPTATLTPTPSGPSVYVVQEGDSLFSIATQFKTDIATLLALNPSIDPATLIIRIGDQIIIPGPDTQIPTATPVGSNVPSGTVIDYRIVAGDTLAAIAERFNSTVDAILKANPTIANANDIQAGQIIKVPVNIATPVPTATATSNLPTAPVPPSATPAVTNTPQP